METSTIRPITSTTEHRRHSILWRVILYFAVASIALSICVSAAIVVWNYQQQTDAFKRKLEDIRVGYSESLGSSLWFYDEIQIRSQVKGIMNLDAISYVRHSLINRRISLMAEEVNERLNKNSFEPLSTRPGNNLDEIDVLILAFNALSEQMNDELKQKTQAQQQLKTINLELEDRVKERTNNLQCTVDELNQTLAELHTTQSKLIESEKLSSLGGMVAGIAHEINTPLGLCITIHSYISDHYLKMKEAFEQGEMRKQNFVEFVGMMDESLTILDKNLQRAAHLIKSFKQVSEDQTGEHIRKFSLHDYLHEILETLSPKFKQNQHKVEIDCSEQLWMQTYAGSISQVLTNLIMNSLLHGFEHKKDGHIRIQAAEERGNIVIRYSDDGIGLTAEAKTKIFDPFYTTKRGHGGTGLGMHLVYNIVNQRLKGDIQVEDSEQGAAFRLVIPKVTEEHSTQI